MPGPTITVKCSRCTGEYVANKQHYNKLQRNGLPNFCPACVRKKRAKECGPNATRARVSAYLERVNEFRAPCQMRIVPARSGPRSRCKPALAGRCPLDMFEQCLNFVAHQDWGGWRVAE